MDGATTLGTGTLNGAGVATFTTSTLSVGHHTITAVYGGDASFNASTSNTVDQVVQKADTDHDARVLGESVEGRAVGDVHGDGDGRGAGGRHGDRDGDLHGRGDDAGHGHAQRRRGRDLHDGRRWRWAITPSRRSTAAMRASTRARRTPSTRRCRRRTPRPRSRPRRIRRRSGRR